MRIVKDIEGKDWKIPPFTLGIALRLKQEAGFDILDSPGKTREEAAKSATDMFAKLYNPMTLGAVLWVLLEPQAKEKSLDQEKFADVFSSDEYPSLRNAVLESIVDFTLPPAVATEIKADLPGLMTKAEAASIAAWKSSVSGWEASLVSTRGPSA